MGQKTSNDYGRLQKALQVRQGLIETKAFGPDVQNHRYVGIVVADEDSESLSYEEDYIDDETAEFIGEAEEIQERAQRLGMQADILLASTREQVLSFVGQISITDVVLIGHGQLARYSLAGENLSWWHIARGVDHLKQGYFIQRHCGALWQNLNVAVGAFAVSDMRNVIAPVGCYFTPTSLDDDANRLLTRVYYQPNHTYQELVQMHPKSP